MVIFLIGYMGSGKSSLGKPLANRLGYEFVDMDKFIESSEGVSIREMFELKGERYFRDKERQALIDFQGRDKLVVSTGGGVPCFGDNMDIINKIGISIYLRIDVDTLIARLITGISSRPLLMGKSIEELREYVSDNLRIREPFYLRSMYTIEGKNIKSEDIATMLHLSGDVFGE